MQNGTEINWVIVAEIAQLTIFLCLSSRLRICSTPGQLTAESPDKWSELHAK
jgi:hypothetical protein